MTYSQVQYINLVFDQIVHLEEQLRPVVSLEEIQGYPSEMQPSPSNLAFLEERLALLVRLSIAHFGKIV